MSKIVLGQNQYGKAEVRLVKITRDTQRHEIEDVSVTSQLRGDLDAVHTEGDNSHVVATDTQKNTVYAFARDGVGSIEKFAMRLGRHFTGEFEWITGGRWERTRPLVRPVQRRETQHRGHHRRRSDVDRVRTQQHGGVEVDGFRVPG